MSNRFRETSPSSATNENNHSLSNLRKVGEFRLFVVFHWELYCGNDVVDTKLAFLYLDDITTYTPLPNTHHGRL